MSSFLGFLGGAMQIGLFFLVIFGVAECVGNSQERYAMEVAEAINQCMGDGDAATGGKLTFEDCASSRPAPDYTLDGY